MTTRDQTTESNDHALRAIAFLLPQFHPIPENDEWWGKGFTEWTNVSRAQPLFKGHYQPNLPSDLGFYDLRLKEARAAQAELALSYGITGFCYYHYWFNGRRVLNRPFDEVLQSGEPDFPFCLCWANENWTRVWDGGENKVLLRQEYGDADDADHFRSLITAFKDPRYIKVDGRPVFLVYRTGILPDPLRTAATWRKVASESGIADPYLIRVESHYDSTDPRSIGFDASTAFAPFNGRVRSLYKRRIPKTLSKLGILPRALAEHRILDYKEVLDRMSNEPLTDYKRFHCVSPGWDNTARRAVGGTIVLGSSPELYREWVTNAAARTLDEHRPEERLLFINAWNEWAEGNHLEPDMRYGHAYLAATLDGIRNARRGTNVPAPSHVSKMSDPNPPIETNALKLMYWRLSSEFARYSMSRRELSLLKAILK